MLVAFRFSFVVFFTIHLCFENEMPTIKEFESLLDSKLQPIQAKLDDFVKQMNDNYTALQTKLDLLEARNASLVAENATLSRRLQSCETCLNNLEQYSRRECIEISGIPEVKDENTDNIVIKVGSLIGLDLTKNDISVSHRLPKGSYSAAVREGPKLLRALAQEPLIL